MKARGIMKHRATIERKASAADTGGGFTETWSTVAANVPCRAWFINSTNAVLSERPGIMETRFVLVPKGTDVQVGDRLASVTNRQGSVLYSGPLIVDSVGEREDHIPLVTRRIV